ncbi:unnamed protein product [Cuscuta campestris]|uniref:F-box domain-containing protein n=1 Tax=Cuscuta campestris TaxID=132261 RepID=A0A484KVY8_9ASTE|nr:unnamed protein product [Cuscuta campestris]
MYYTRFSCLQLDDCVPAEPVDDWSESAIGRLAECCDLSQGSAERECCMSACPTLRFLRRLDCKWRTPPILWICYLESGVTGLREAFAQKKAISLKMNEVKRYRPFSEIPSALLWEILIRVPIKTCLACKLVCKEWYHIVKSSEFSSLHRRFNASEFAILLYNDSGGGGGGSGTTFILVELKKALDVDDSGDCVVGVGDLIRVQPNIATPRGTCGTWYLRSHCDGAICLETVTSEYVVCHLLTRRSVNVQNLHELKKPPCVIKHCELGRCPVTAQFKVLMFLYDTVYEILVAKIQTLGNGEWRIVGNVPFNHMSDGCFLNGSSHWRGPTCIWSFHFGKEEFLQIPLPDDIIRRAPHRNNNNNNNPVESHYSRVSGRMDDEGVRCQKLLGEATCHRDSCVDRASSADG